jgi:hypothetical protein
MEPLLICTGVILVTIAITYWFILCAIANAKKAIIAKQDALMAKLIEIKNR